MAKGKNNGKKNKNANLKAAYQTKREIWGVVIIALGLFLGASLYSDAVGIFGRAISGFVFGMFGKRPVHDRLVPVVCILAPALSWVIQWALKTYLGYTTSFELLIINALLTIAGLFALTIGAKAKTTE